MSAMGRKLTLAFRRRGAESGRRWRSRLSDALPQFAFSFPPICGGSPPLISVLAIDGFRSSGGEAFSAPTFPTA